MKAYIIKRLLSLVPILFVVAAVVFFIVHLAPGGPAAVILGPQATPEAVENLKEQLGLNLPIFQQFLNWLAGLFQGDLGQSISMGRPVLEVFLSHLGPTLSLAILAQGLSILFAIPFGIIASNWRGTSVDQSIMILAMLGISIPSFLLALLLMLLFGVNLNLLPVAGYEPLSSGLWNHLKYMILPAISLGAIQTAVIARMTRSSMLDILSMNYIKTARAKGVKEQIVTYKHALRNAFLPILTVLGETFGTLVAGAVVTETVFNLPGIGQLIINAIVNRDYALIQGTILIIAVSYVFINLIVDLLYGIVDPRVRLNRKG